MSEERLVKCIDGHPCANLRCAEAPEGERECIIAARDLYRAALSITKINIRLGVYLDPTSPTLEEHANAVNMTSTILETARRLGVSQNALIIEIFKIGESED